MPLKGSSTTIEPSSSSATTVRFSRAQRACSGETHTRATCEPSISPVRGQPPTSATGSRSGRGSKRSSSATALLIRSSRKCFSRSSTAASVPRLAAVEQRVRLDPPLGEAPLVPVLELEQPVLVNGALDRVRHLVRDGRRRDLEALLDQSWPSAATTFSRAVPSSGWARLSRSIAATSAFASIGRSRAGRSKVSEYGSGSTSISPLGSTSA